MTCEHCGYAAKFHSYQRRRVLTVHGAMTVARAYCYCGRCRQSFMPYDDVLGLVDEISPGLMPLVCLAGTVGGLGATLTAFGCKRPQHGWGRDTNRKV